MKKLLMFLMIAIPIFIVLIVNFTVSVVVGDVFISVDKIELDKTSVVANVDDRISLKAYIYPQNATNQDVVWKSENEDIAQVDENGNVVFVGFGNGYITATSSDGNKIAKCYFYVTDSKVHKVVLSSSSSNVEVGKTLQLTATIFPAEAVNKNLIFSSSDESIAKVDSNGLVYGISSGNVTISVKTEDGGFVDSINLQIIIPIKGIVIEEKEVVVSKTFYNIIYNVVPENATNKKIKFSVDNPAIATVNEKGLVEFKKAGTVYVTLSDLNGNYKQTIKITSTDGYAFDLNISETSMNIEVGQSSLLIDYSVVPLDIYNTQVVFSSSNEKVVFVNENGYITAVGGGDAIITIKVEKSLNNFIVKQVYVHVESPAQNILIDDIITAEKFVTLFPVSYPEDSTNTKFFFHSENENVAVVNSFGEIEILTDQPTNFSILIYANEDYSNVFKRVNILYTAGQAYHFELQDKNIKLEYGQSYTLNCSFKPSNVSIKNLNIEVVSQSNENGILKIEKDGTLLAIGGGQCKLKVSVVLYDGTISEQYCDVVVERRPENIEINLDLQQKDGQFITSKSSLNLIGVVYPLDSTNKNITWVVDDKNIAVVVDNVLIFNQAGVVTLTASCEGVSKSVEIFYTGSYPISAEVGVREDGNIISIPQTIYVGDSFEVVLKSIFPNDTTNVNISLRVTNQITSSANGKVISVDGNCFTAINGGSAKLIINISSSLQISYEITVIRIPERIEVDIANGKTTKQTVQLQTNVFPIDTTNKNVKFFIVNNSEIAKIEGNELIFSENGKVTIKAVCEANSNVFIEFTVEKIEKEPILIPYNSTSSSLTLGDLACFDVNDFNLNYDHFEIEILEQLTQEEWENVVEINDDVIKVVGLGKATVKLVFMKEMQVVESYVHVINAVQYVEDIVFESGLDRYGDDYVTALEVLNLNFSVLPNNANNKELKFEIEESYSSVGISESIAYLNNGKIFFIKSGTILLKVTSQDFGGVSKSFRIRYTGGYAIDAELSVNSEIYLSIGQTITIDVEKWIPKDVINTLILIKEIGHTSGIQIIEIDNVTKTITALNGGVSQIIVELSNGIVKEITINVLKTVTDIKIEKEEYLISGNSLTINATVVPNTATNKVLKYELLETDIATISGNTITFIKAGTVYVKITSTDGSNVSKTIKITSTLGYIGEIVLNTKETTINKGNKFILYMLSCMPNDASFKDVFYKIISFKSIDGSNNDVIQLGENGEIIGLYGGEAIVRVYCFDYYGNEVYSDCKITVRTAVDSVDVSFDQKIDNYLNKSTFITSKNQLTFNKVVFPADAWCKDFVYEVSNLEIAEVVGNKIVFKQKGSVVIKFISKDDSMGEKSKTYTFIYTGGDLVEIEIDKTNIENDRIIINAGENFAFEIASMIPSDCHNLKYSFKNFEEQRVDLNKQVGIFEGNAFYGMNGGSVSFDLSVNNIFVGRFTIIVERKANGININGDELVFVSAPSYSIVANALPSDTHQTKLGFRSENEKIAKVNADGSVEFYSLGKVVITIYVIDNPSVFKQIEIEYTKELQSISFSQSKTKMYVGEFVDFNIISNPIDVNDFEIEIILSDPSIADITIINGVYRLIGKSGGKVVVTAKVVGKDISFSKEFTFYPKITDIQLELDKVDDNVGLGQYRYFGTKFVQNNKIINTFQMKFTLLPSNDFANLLEWSSSNSEIATVDENGVVTVLKAGNVTITVKQIAPYDNAATAIDSYEFNFVEGINIYGNDDFIYVYGNRSTLKPKSLVLQKDILNYDKTIAVTFNIHGNGHIFDFSKSGQNAIYIAQSNVVLDNLTIRKITFEGGFALSDLEKVGNLVVVHKKAENVTIYNCIIENATAGIQVLDAKIKTAGCIFRNTYFAGIKLTKADNNPNPPEVVVEDCIFAHSLLAGILYDVDSKRNTTMEPAKVTLIGEVRFYCWKTFDELEQGFSNALKNVLGSFDLSGAFTDIVNQVENIFSKYNDYKYIYNNKEYFNISIVSFNINFAGKQIDSGTITLDKSKLNASCNYENINCEGTITIAGLANSNFNFQILTLPSKYPFIKPSDTYIGNQYVLSLIKQPKLY